MISGNPRAEIDQPHSPVWYGAFCGGRCIGRIFETHTGSPGRTRCAAQHIILN